MNKEAANTMLKFLEEPDGNVIGFFVTNEKDNIMPTIRSRTQIIEALFAANQYEKYNISLDKYNELYDILQKYLNKIEIEKKGLIIYNRDYFQDLEKNDIKIIMQMMLDKYSQILYCKLENKSLNDEDKYLEFLNIPNLKRKINYLIELLNEINYNVNIEMFLDRLVLEFEVINNETL